MTEAQARTGEQVRELAAVQRETSRSIGELMEGWERLRKQVGGLGESLGGDIEDIAYIVLCDVLRREFGWRVGRLGRSWEKWGDETEEVNFFGLPTDPTRLGETIWIVGEAKHNLTVREVERFVQQVERARRHLGGGICRVLLLSGSSRGAADGVGGGHPTGLFPREVGVKRKCH